MIQESIAKNDLQELTKGMRFLCCTLVASNQNPRLTDEGLQLETRKGTPRRLYLHSQAKVGCFQSPCGKDLASEMALWQLQHPPQDPVPPVEVEGEAL